MHDGSCLCGRIRYRVNQALDDATYCHCRSCRKASGSAFGANANVDRSNFELHDPDGLLKEFESSPGKVRAFCSGCGSPILAYRASIPDVVRIRLGSLDSPFAGRAKAHVFVSDKADWAEITDDLPQFDTWGPRPSE